MPEFFILESLREWGCDKLFLLGRVEGEPVDGEGAEDVGKATVVDAARVEMDEYGCMGGRVL